jgi:hypothetical protein
MHGILKLRSQIQQDPSLGWRTRYGAHNTVEVLPDEGEELVRRYAENVPGSTEHGANA